MQKIVSFLMFSGQAEEAMNIYISLFPNSEVVSVIRYKAGEPGAEGTVMHASFTLSGQLFMCIDSYASHGFSFTPSMSLYISCESNGEIDTLYQQLSDGGTVLMTLGAYPFSKKYGWINDKFGISWKLNYDS